VALKATHQNRHLCGKIVVADSLRQIRHVSFLFEDLRSGLVLVRVYNTNRIFRLVETLIIEPFYKVAADMIPMVRVDNPSEIEDWEPSALHMQWKNFGDRFGLSDDLENSLFCYEAGMNAFTDPNYRANTAILSANIAMCDFNLGSMLSSPWYADVAASLDGKNKKAW
jgi:hypothetical protein